MQQANTLPRIIQASDKQIATILVYLYNLTGIPTERLPQTHVLVGYIKNTFSKSSLLDFISAFTLAVGLKLDLKDPNPYNNFTTLYIENVMQSYNRLRFKLLDDYKKTRYFHDKVIELSDDEKRTALYNWAQGAYDTYLVTGKFLNLGPLYEKLKANGIITFTDAREDELKKESESFIFHKGSKYCSIGESFDLLNNSTPDDAFHYHALTVFFDELRETNTTLAELFNLVPQAV
jgi:hypothetical protein